MFFFVYAICNGHYYHFLFGFINDGVFISFSMSSCVWKLYSSIVFIVIFIHHTLYLICVACYFDTEKLIAGPCDQHTYTHTDTNKKI